MSHVSGYSHRLSPAAIALGAVISAPLLMLGGVFFFVMKVGPADAEWLSADAKTLLATRLEEDRRLNTVAAALPLGQVFVLPSVLWLSAINFGMNLAAAGRAIINSVGNLSGVVGPFVMGWIRDGTGSLTIGLLAVAIGPPFAALAMFTLRREHLR